MFASKNLFVHMFRGTIGVAALAVAFALAPVHPIVSVAFIPVGMLALRGCPMCWTIGLFETIAAKIQGKDAPTGCTDG
jgi:hypothetical protein